eukprot:CAMPEP_0204570806 /NCGR_PEP_ID=MMETSP0661-20131031/38532_1 /ASSEMBLY_ACC=CAM_ASM_000606 /TAXON_ID=109239 /ORGANISM="Alexandrium margalefi, Strain AMGDE01CS-322" /LENGTH=196 /DNA_ID=CAMNT_0051579021 /DNA_START=35 /DNA_END=624 /DNA_ORIENTATION=-
MRRPMRHARALLAALLLPRLLLAAAALEPESAGLACDEDDVSPECAAVPGRALLQRTVHQLSGEASEDGKMGVMMKDGERGSAVGSLASQPGVLPVELAEAVQGRPEVQGQQRLRLRLLGWAQLLQVRDLALCGVVLAARAAEDPRRLPQDLQVLSAHAGAHARAHTPAHHAAPAGNPGHQRPPVPLQGARQGCVR